MPLKKSIRMKASTRASTSAPVKKSTRPTAAIGAGAIGLVVIGVIAAAMLIGTHEPSPTANAGAWRENAAAYARANVAPASMAPLVADVPAVESPAKAAVRKSPPITITGCLERADETFRLKNTAGVDAPKSRSWKSGFLKKGSASIEVVDAANRLKLADHVGQRVSVTGILVDREMDVRSLRRVAASCTSSGQRVTQVGAVRAADTASH